MLKRIPLVTGSIVTAVILMLPISTSSQRTKVGTIDAVEGAVTVTRQAVESRPLTLNEDVLLEDRIVTSTKSMARIRFAADGTAEMRELSVVTISEKLGKFVLHLEDGAMYYRGLRGRSRRGESQTIRTPNAIVRATGSVVVGAERAPHGAPVTAVWVREGKGFAAALSGAEVEVRQGNSVLIVGDVLGPTSPFPPPQKPLYKYLPGGGSRGSWLPFPLWPTRLCELTIAIEPALSGRGWHSDHGSPMGSSAGEPTHSLAFSSFGYGG